MNKNIAVIGSGYWGKNLIKNFYNLGRLKYIYDENKESEKKQRDLYNIEPTEFHHILKDSEIRGVVISTPADTHHLIAKKCIEANKNVFIEKPICLNMRDAKDLKEISEKKNVKIMVGHLLNYNDHFNKIFDIVKKRDLGKLIKIKSIRKSFGKLREHENVIWSFAPHDISMVNRFTDGDTENLRVIKNSYFNKNCDSANISYSKSDVSIEIEVDWSSIEKIHRLELFYSNAIIVFEDSQPDSDKKLYILNTKFNEEVLKDKSNLDKEYISVKSQQPLLNECNHFIDCIESDLMPLTNVDESLLVLQTLLDTDEK